MMTKCDIMRINFMQRQYDEYMMALCDVMFITFMQRQYSKNMMNLCASCLLPSCNVNLSKR